MRICDFPFCGILAARFASSILPDTIRFPIRGVDVSTCRHDVCFLQRILSALCQLRRILCGIQQRGARAPLQLLVVSIRSILADYFFTPVYSSTVFDVIVVVVFVLSPTCVYVAVVEIVRHALHEVMPTLIATQTIATNTKINFLMLSRFLVNKINDLLLSEGAHKDASRDMFRSRTGVYAYSASFWHSAH